MKHFTFKIKVYISLLFLTLCSMIAVDVAMAQEKPKPKVDFGVGIDLVSTYVWRGFYNAGISLQPTMSVKVGGFSLTAWGSTDFTASGYKEADITAAYTIKGLTVSLTDYYWTGVSSSSHIPSRNYFHFDAATTPHRIEIGASYRVSEKVPITLSWYTMLWGADKKENGQQNYSSYAEIMYPFAIKNIVDLSAWVGFTPWDTKGTYGTDGFAVCNVGLGATKAIRCSDKFSLPIFARVIWNPAMQDVNFVGGITVAL